MALYAIGDLHLSFQVYKPMDVFGSEGKTAGYRNFVGSAVFHAMCIRMRIILKKRAGILLDRILCNINPLWNIEMKTGEIL